MLDHIASLDGPRRLATAQRRSRPSTALRQLPLLTLLTLLSTSFSCQAKRLESETPPTVAQSVTQHKQTGTEAEAQLIWQQTLIAYRTAHHYQDDATIKLSYSDGGRRFEDQTSIAVSWSKPNRLAVNAYQVQLVCDGQQLRASIQDRSTGNLDGQTLTRTAPATLSSDDLLSDPLLADQLRNSLLNSESGRLPPQLELLLEDGDRDLLAAPQTSLRQLDRKALAG
ncbi:MAG: hypothetical protein ACKOUR_09200, partial [Planctomycetota bacterium]